MRASTFIIVLMLIPLTIRGQLKIKGKVLEYSSDGTEMFLSGIRVFWLESNIETSTDDNGQFSIPYSREYSKLVIDSPNHISDTIVANRPDLGKIRLIKQVYLDEVVVKKEVEPLQKSLFTAQNVITVSSREMLKAACCNLSESFETNPSVDVNVSDAITGAKQIQMLGLTSPYLLFTQENMPLVKGASQIYGLSFIPGSWIESIQITKGSGNVVNGFESISGQINTEVVKPFLDRKLFLNVYANNFERYEFNARYNQILSDKIATGIYVHANLRDGKIEDNSDTFLDTPLAKQINVMNRWQYMDPKTGWVSFLNIQYLEDEKQTGQVSFVPERDKLTNNVWGSEVKTNRIDLSCKLGYVFPELPYQSMGLQIAYSKHDQDSYYGLNIYNILHDSFYSNFIFNGILGSTQHKFKTGMNFNHDHFNENVNTTFFARTDESFGGFFEYTYDSLEKLSLVAGMRIDHNRIKTFLTPRLHLRYSLWEKASLRASVGKGKRAANIFAENQQLFASSRAISIFGNDGTIYGLSPERAWNFGAGFIQKFYLWNKPFEFSLDFYRTVFKDQVVVDWEDPNVVSFYNLSGKSSSNSVQVDLNYELLQNLDIRMTYKNYDVTLDYLSSGNLERPYQPLHRFFTNLSYETTFNHSGAHWRFDFTYNWLGKQRLPRRANEMPTVSKVYSTDYGITNFQVTRVFSHKFEAYLGGENIGDFIQKNPIVGSNDPFGPFFDTTQVFAPVLGATYYIGMRFKLLTKEL